MLYSHDISQFFICYVCIGPFLLTVARKLNLHSGGPKLKNDHF